MKFKRPKNEKPLKKTKAIPFDVDTIKKTQKYADQHGLSFSAVVRLATNDFFLNQGEN